MDIEWKGKMTSNRPSQQAVQLDIDLLIQEIINQCKNVYGSGSCVEPAPAGGALATYTTSQTVTATPTGYVAPTKPAWAVEGYGTTVAIPVYTPAVLWPTASI